MSIATLLSQHHQVTAVDIVPEKVELINNRKSPIQDDYIEKYLAEKELNLTATLDAKAAYADADFVVIAAPTNYDSQEYCQKLMKYRVLKKLGPSFNCRFSATAVDSPCKRIPISEKLLEEIVRNALTAQIKQAEHILEILHERERKALICFSALERQEEKLSAEKAELQRAVPQPWQH